MWPVARARSAASLRASHLPKAPLASKTDSGLLRAGRPRAALGWS